MKKINRIGSLVFIYITTSPKKGNKKNLIFYFYYPKSAKFDKLSSMVISSIDLKNGHVVQLKNGKELVLQRDDADSLIADFDMYGEVAVIDLDAALGNVDEKGNTANTTLLKSLLHHGNVRTGGGIRTVKRAKELVSLGAEKVIIGSAAWKANPAAGESVLNEDFLNELAAAIGKDRIIISVDAINGKIAVKGWTETVDIPLVEGAKQAEKFCSELLFTCVEKEGCMQGTNMDYVRQLREAVSCRVVVAGGVSSVEEIAELETIDISQFGFDEAELSPEQFDEDFELPDGEKGEFQQMTFTLHNEQAELIKYALETVDECVENFGNTNKNGNALYEVVRQWAEQRK